MTTTVLKEIFASEKAINSICLNTDSRQIASSSEASIQILDTDLNILASYPDLLPSGIVNLHACGQNFIVVGTSNCYIMTKESVSNGQQGRAVENEYLANG